jgi:hypothetical protein
MAALILDEPAEPATSPPPYNEKRPDLTYWARGRTPMNCKLFLHDGKSGYPSASWNACVLSTLSYS